MAKYNVGDRVRVRDDLQSNKWYNPVYFASDMDIYRGNVYVVSSIASIYDNIYRLADDSGSVLGDKSGAWVFSDKMLEGYREYYQAKVALEDILF